MVILLPEDRFKALKPSETTSYDDCVLVNKNNMSKINEQINEFEAETLDEFAKQKYKRHESFNLKFPLTTIHLFNTGHFKCD